MKYFDDVAKYLTDIPQTERDDMLDYYEELSLDAGYTNKEVREKYGTPTRFAKKLRAEYWMDIDDKKHEKQQKERAAKQINDNPEEKLTNSKLIWAVIAAVIAAPIAIPMVIVAVVVLFAVIFAIVAMIVGVVVSFVAVTIAAILAVVSGIAIMGQAWAIGLYWLGGGLLTLGLMIIFVPVVYLVIKALSDMTVTFAKYVGRKVSQHSEVDHD